MLDPKNLTVYVVGIERYAGGARWNLKGPVRDALDFAEWLVARGLPVGNVTAFLSPLAAGDSLAERPRLKGLVVRGAEHGDIYSALADDLALRKPRHFCLFWGGHGCVKGEGRRHLVCADATEENVRSIDLNAFMKYLQTEAVGVAPVGDLWNSIVIADACASFSFTQSLDRRLTWQNFPETKDVDRSVCALFATDSGELARNLSAENTGLFSRELRQKMQDLTSLDDLAHMGTIGLELRTHFEQLAFTGHRKQTPTFYSVQPFRDAESVLGRSIGEEIDRRGAAHRALPGEFAELCAILRAMPTAISEVECRRMFSASTVMHTAPPESRGAAGYYEDCAWELNQMFPGPLFTFLELTRKHIRDAAIGKQLRAWELAVAKRLGVELDSWHAKAKTTHAAAADVLQIVVAPVFGYPVGEEHYEIFVGLQRSSTRGAGRFKTFPATAPVREKELPVSLRSIIRTAEESSQTADELRVEAVLPKELFPDGACHWKARWGAHDLQIGKRYAVALRSYERGYFVDDYRGPRRLQKSKWGRLEHGVTNEQVAWCESIASLAEREMHSWSEAETLALCALALAGERREHVDHAIEYLIGAGIPLGVWFCNPAHPANGWRELVQQRFLTVPRAKWLSVAREFHQCADAERELGCAGLTLLWDDPAQPLLKLPDRAGAPLQAPSTGSDT